MIDATLDSPWTPPPLRRHATRETLCQPAQEGAGVDLNDLLAAGVDMRPLLRTRYETVHALWTRLAGTLPAEDRCVRSISDASLIESYLAHATRLFETIVLKVHAADRRAFNPRYACLFNSYYEALDPGHPRPQRGMLRRPSFDEVRRHRARQRRDGALFRASRSAHAGTGRPADHARPARRTAAPGADAHRPEAPAVAQPAATKLPVDDRADRCLHPPHDASFAPCASSARRTGYAAMRATPNAQRMPTGGHSSARSPCRRAGASASMIR